MLTAPITTPAYFSRIKDVVKAHHESLKDQTPVQKMQAFIPAPVLSHLTPQDVFLDPFNVSQSLIALTSPWIDLCSTDPVIADVSAQVLRMELTYASFCGVSTVLLRGPTFRGGVSPTRATAQFASALLHAMKAANYLHIYLWIPMTGLSLASVSNKQVDLNVSLSNGAENTVELSQYDSWDVWNTIRTVCKYSSRLGLGK